MGSMLMIHINSHCQRNVLRTIICCDGFLVTVCCRNLTHICSSLIQARPAATSGSAGTVTEDGLSGLPKELELIAKRAGEGTKAAVLDKKRELLELEKKRLALQKEHVSVYTLVF